MKDLTDISDKNMKGARKEFDEVIARLLILMQLLLTIPCDILPFDLFSCCFTYLASFVLHIGT